MRQNHKSLKTTLLLTLSFFLSPLHASNYFSNQEIEHVEGSLKNGVSVQIGGHDYPVRDLTHVNWHNNDEEHLSQRYITGNIEFSAGPHQTLPPFLLPKIYRHQRIGSQRIVTKIPGQEGWVRIEESTQWYQWKDNRTYTAPYEWVYDEHSTIYRIQISDPVSTSCRGIEKCYPIKSGLRWGKYHRLVSTVEASINSRCIYRFPDGTIQTEETRLGQGPMYQGTRLTKNCPYC